MNRLPRLFCLVPFLCLAACGADSGDALGYDQALLARYRAALPSEERMAASSPEDAGRQTGDAHLPQMAQGAVTNINGVAVQMVRMLDFIVSLPPTVYNSETKEFVWGPWDNDDGFGQVAVTIRENPPEDDFEYGYAFVRLPSNDAAEWTPVIWGAVTPDPDDEEKGVGVTLWDLEANRTFDETYDPDNAKSEAGRFVMAYGAGSDGEAEYAYNLAIFRGFVPDDSESGDPMDLDYYFGRWDDGTHNLTFLDWVQTGELCDVNGDCWEDASAGSDLDEVFGIQMAFLDDGLGRAEGSLSGGDLGDTVYDIVECWDPLINTSYWKVGPWEVGEVASCTPLFTQTLAADGDDLTIPGLDDVDAETYDAMVCVALNGIDGCE